MPRMATEDRKKLDNSNENHSVEIQASIDQVNENTSLTKLYREELEDYLDKVNSKMDSDGNALITVPKNFNDIVNAMTREDLLESENVENANISFGEDEKIEDKGEKDPNSSSRRTSNSKLATAYGGMMKANWYKYLLEDSMNHAMNQEYEGRYSDILLSKPNSRNKSNSKAVVDEEQIKKGMAEIFYLDRELWKLNKQIKIINSRPISSSSTGERDGNLEGEEGQETVAAEEKEEEEEHNEEEKPSPRSQSVPNTPKDTTFVTKRYDSGFGERTIDSSRKASHTPRQSKPPVSARSQLSVPSTARTVKSAKVEAKDNYEVGFDEFSDEDEVERDGNSPKAPLRAFKKLTAEQESKLEEILARPEEFYADKDTVLTHYYDATLLEQNHHLDESLAQYAHLDRLALDRDTDELKALLEAQKKKDYLAQQLLERKERQYELRISKLLASSTQQTIDLEAFLFSDEEQVCPGSVSPSAHTTNSMNTMVTGRSKYTQNLAELPQNLDEIHPEVPITLQDVQLLIANLKDQYQQQRIHQDNEHGHDNDNDNHSSNAQQIERDSENNNNSTANNSSNINVGLASRDAISSLVSQYQVEIIQLTNLRHRSTHPLSTPQLSSNASINTLLRDQRHAIYNAIEDDALGLLDVHNLPYYHDTPSLDTDNISISSSSPEKPAPLVNNSHSGKASHNHGNKARKKKINNSKHSEATSGTEAAENNPFSSDDLQQLQLQMLALEQQNIEVACLMMPLPPSEALFVVENDNSGEEYLKLPRIPSTSSSRAGSSGNNNCTDSNYQSSRILVSRRVEPSITYKSPRNVHNSMGSPAAKQFVAHCNDDWEEIIVNTPSSSKKQTKKKPEELIEQVRKFVSC